MESPPDVRISRKHAESPTMFKIRLTTPARPCHTTESQPKTHQQAASPDSDHLASAEKPYFGTNHRQSSYERTCNDLALKTL